MTVAFVLGWLWFSFWMVIINWSYDFVKDFVTLMESVYMTLRLRYLSVHIIRL
ncbi:hypothetical protein WN51_00383 [Melipona quadrifasciata]|uniref:Uncharacterized protein n=1 Tax=Melipona quadrifasciata TaxID=166423 RepID=A0A0M9A1Z9_9HYME|nr:hypothetical protein WN51_00383 [Melipona quadrifasciata]